MTSRLLTSFLLALLWLLCPRRALSCQCSPETADAALRRADLIVEGTVVRQRPSTTGESQGVVDLNAVRTLRGEPVGPTLSIKNGLECAPQVVEPGKRYVVYLSSQQRLMTACSRVVETVSLSPEELAAFGRAATPSPERPDASPPAGEPKGAQRPTDVHASTPRHERPGAGGCASCAVDAGADHSSSALAALAIALLLGRRHRRSRVAARPRPRR